MYLVKLRGMASGSLIDPDFFIIMDRLFATMVVRIEEWRQRAKGTLFGMMIGKKNKLAQQQLLVERMTVAYDLAAAFFYLHENRLIYRDIKPENIVRETLVSVLLRSLINSIQYSYSFVCILPRRDRALMFEATSKYSTLDFASLFRTTCELETVGMVID
jgi:serine/threonine protein kinase